MSDAETAGQADLLADVRHWAQRELAPRAAEDEREARFPRDAFDALAARGLSGVAFPADDGGAGQPYELYLRVLEEIARAHVVVALTLSVHTLATSVVARHASAALRAEVLGRMTGGELLGAYSLSEPGSGSDAAALVTRAERDGDDYVINGVKAWVSHAAHADFTVLFARTGAHHTRGISAFYVAAGTPGVAVAAPERKMGMAASPTAQVVYSDARIPAGHRLGAEGQGFPIALAALDGGRLGIAACATGLAQCALDHAVAHAAERRQFGQPIGAFQGVAFLLADMATGVEAARALCREAARHRDAGQDHTRLASMAKLAATDTAMRVTTDAVQVLGARGYATASGVERLLREAKVMQIFEGTNQIQRLVIARRLLGE